MIPMYDLDVETHVGHHQSRVLTETLQAILQSKPEQARLCPSVSTQLSHGYGPLTSTRSNDHDGHTFSQRPLFGLLLFDNVNSDARDHCANERTFLSWLRLSIYMAIVSVAIMISFHLKSQATAVERRAALPFGIIFWLLSLACLASGFANYVRTVTKYSQRVALVQSGWKTQLVSLGGVQGAWLI